MNRHSAKPNGYDDPIAGASLSAARVSLPAPYLERIKEMHARLSNPIDRGRAQVELAREFLANDPLRRERYLEQIVIGERESGRVQAAWELFEREVRGRVRPDCTAHAELLRFFVRERAVQKASAVAADVFACEIRLEKTVSNLLFRSAELTGDVRKVMAMSDRLIAAGHPANPNSLVSFLAGKGAYSELRHALEAAVASGDPGRYPEPLHLGSVIKRIENGGNAAIAEELRAIMLAPPRRANGIPPAQLTEEIGEHYRAYLQHRDDLALGYRLLARLEGEGDADQLRGAYRAVHMADPSSIEPQRLALRALVSRRGEPRTLLADVLADLSANQDRSIESHECCQMISALLNSRAYESALGMLKYAGARNFTLPDLTQICSAFMGYFVLSKSREEALSVFRIGAEQGAVFERSEMERLLELHRTASKSLAEIGMLLPTDRLSSELRLHAVVRLGKLGKFTLAKRVLDDAAEKGITFEEDMLEAAAIELVEANHPNSALALTDLLLDQKKLPFPVAEAFTKSAREFGPERIDALVAMVTEHGYKLDHVLYTSMCIAYERKPLLGAEKVEEWRRNGELPVRAMPRAAELMSRNDDPPRKEAAVEIIDEFLMCPEPKQDKDLARAHVVKLEALIKLDAADAREYYASLNEEDLFRAREDRSVSERFRKLERELRRG